MNFASSTISLLLLLTASCDVFTQAFQQPISTKSSIAFKRTSSGIFITPSSTTATATATATTTALNVKFRLDNDDDDNYELDSKEQQTMSYKNDNKKYTIDDGIDTNNNDNNNQQPYENTAPATTFGAEAVPEAQRPANEYMELLASPLFDWANRDPNADLALSIRLGVLYAALFGLICWPISGATFTVEGYELHKFFSSNIGAFGFVLIIVLRLYTGWGYVGSRLQSKEIEYEETGWYDGDIELKTESEIARDLFLYRQDVKPVVDRLKKFTLIVGSLWIASCVGLNVAFNAKPMFNEFDADMLKTLNYDDKRANVAAEQSGGRPTYCDSRYYRAVANGGQGC